MADLILDGYSRRAVLLDGSHMVYRPILRAHHDERRRFRWEVKFLGKSAQRLIDQWLWSHIVGWDWELDYGYQTLTILRNRNEPLLDQIIRLIHGVEVDASGEKWRDVEAEWAQNLYDGVRLEIQDQRLARRDCGDCQKFWYLDNGQVMRNSAGEMELRPEGALVSCQTEFGCLKGTPETQKSLSVANRWAYRHFRSCESIGTFPDDPIVRHNAGIIRKAIESLKPRQNMPTRTAVGRDVPGWGLIDGISVEQFLQEAKGRT